MEINKFLTEQSSRKDIYNVISLYYNKTYLTELLSDEQKKYMEVLMKEYNMLGLNLSDELSNRVTEIKVKLSNNNNIFNNNLSNETTSFDLTLYELEGMNESWLKNRLNEDNKTYHVTLKYPDFVPIMEYCSNRKTREMIFTAFTSRCSLENSELLKNSIILRQELANIFGYTNYTDYILQTKMAKNYNTVMDFLLKLNENLNHVVKNDLEALQQFSKNKIECYDISFYSRLHNETKLNFNKNDLKQYFVLDVVTAGLLRTYQLLLGFKFVDTTESHLNTVWHHTVKVYDVYDDTTNILTGKFYLDLYPRDGKYGHACMMDVINKTDTHLPLIFMVCNFPENENLTFDDVETYFHEFGHVMHGLCSVSTIASLSGTNCETDFVEAPSQIFEEWCYCKDVLRLMAPTIPDNIVSILNKERIMLKGIFNKRQLTFAFYDMTLHSNLDAEKIDVIKTYNNIYYDLFGLNLPEKTNIGASFGHIMGGYESGYYSYLWSQVYAKDMFENKFKGHELDRSIGLEFKKIILSRGGTVDSYDSVVEFLGREPNDKAFVDSFK